MNPVAVDRAREHLDYAREARERMRTATDYKVFARAWSDFLSDAARVYSKLGAGAHGNGKSSAWFGHRKHERKKDELLSYVHHARDSHEHGIEPPTQSGMSLSLGGPPPPGSGQLQGGIRFMIGGRILFALNPRVLLKPVTDERYGDVFNPPKQHLGKPLEDPTPESIADLMIAYLDAMIADAATLSTP